MSENSIWKNAIEIFWKSIPENERQLFRLRVMNTCEISATTFYRWRKSMNLPPYSQRKRINNIAHSMGYERLYKPKKTL
ncbi:MAG: hypothetical protein IKN91_00055 [Paludibacteraceae bacterium]|nr:hypothetical protein [Paludibacteraceae bacterium]